MGPGGASSGGVPTPPPNGFTASSDPVFAQNASTGQVAFFDPLSNAWSIDEPLFGFVPDPSAPGPLTYVDPVSGQQLQYYGYGTWVDPLDHRPPVFHYDPGSGRTAWFNPKTGQWEIPTPPPGYWADISQPSSRLGYFYTDAKGHTAYYSTRDGAWTNWDTGQPVRVSTVERPGTGDAAGRVTVAGPTAVAGPETLAHNSPYSSRLLALKKDNQSAPTGSPARDYARDVKNLEDSKALRQEMAAAGAGPMELAIVDNHIADLEKYVAMWDDHYDETRKFVHGGSTAVNDAAQMDDLGAEMKQAGEIADQAVSHGGMAFVGVVTTHIETTGLGGGGSQVVVPRYRTAAGYLDGKGVPVLRPEPSPVSDEASAGSRAASETSTLPLGDQGARAARAAEMTEVGRPSAGQLEEAQQRAANRQESATGWHGGADDAVRMEVEATEAEARARALSQINDGSDAPYYTPKDGETPAAAAARIGRWESLNNTRFEGRQAVLRLRAAQRELAAVTSGEGKSPSTERTVNVHVDDIESAIKDVEDGQKAFPDYWDRMEPRTRAELEAELEGVKGKDRDYWIGQLRDYQTGRGAEIGGSSSPDVPMAPVPPATMIPATGPHVTINLGGDGSSAAAQDSQAPTPEPAPTGSAFRIKNIRFDPTPPGGGGTGILNGIRLGIVTPLGASVVIGLGAIGAFGGAGVLGTPTHVIQVPVVGQAGPATLPPGPLTISPISATLSADGQTTTYQVMVTNVTGFPVTSWIMNPPSGAPDCNHMTFGPGPMATWHHGAADGCGSFAGSSQGIPGNLVLKLSDGSGFRCTATYSGSLSGTGPAPSCQGGGPTQNPNAGGLTGGTTPSSTLMSQTVPASLSPAGGVLGGVFGVGVGLSVVGTLLPRRRKPGESTRETEPPAAEHAQLLDAPADATAPPKPIMPIAGGKKKRSCQMELDAMNRADRALQKARAAARAANDAVNAAQEAVSAADFANTQAQSNLNQIQSPTAGQAPPRVVEGGTLRQIIRQTDNQGNPLAPTADDVKNVDNAFSHVMTLGEAQRAVDKAAGDLAQAKASLAAAQAAARPADAAVDAAVKAYEDAREAYGKCLQLQREGL